MTLLVFGSSGQLGRALAGPGVTCLSRAEADLGDPDHCAQAIRSARPEAVINAAAFTNVDGAEDQMAEATVINADAPAAMAQACAELGVPFVSVSTDYVFGGQGERPWRPSDPVAPLNAYGQSKATGEAAIAQAGGTWAVIRTAWVISGNGRNFATTMLRLGQERDILRVVADQIGGPTPASDLATACLTVAQGLIETPAKGGIYHFSGAPEVSWADLARALMQAGGRNCDIEDIPSSDYPTPARRPLNSRLDCSDIEAVFGLARPDWRAALPAIVTEADGR